MNILVSKWLSALILSLSFSVQALADDDEKEAPKKLTSKLLSGIKLRSIGPALMSGRIADIAIDPEKPHTWYVAAGSGNVWKTTNAGTTWKPIFENYGSYSIGCLAVDPSNTDIIWVGTGENVGGRHVGFGDGIYKSTDGGGSFKNVGLPKSEHLSKIIVHPENSDVVYVASQGPLWSGGGERGLYKTIDGGKSWKLILSKGEYTGVTDVVMHPSQPEVLYAATHQRHRTVWGIVNGGPETGIFKSIDGGKSWNALTKGLPGEDKGKISLQISPQRPEVVYATIELAGKKGGFWRSEDSGKSWQKRSDYISGGTGPHYYQEIYVDPHRFDSIYQANVYLGYSEDGGKNWRSADGTNKHVDNHAVVFHPTDPDFLLVGCDGGLYRSYDRGKTYEYFPNLPLTQFYKVDVDNDYPFYNIVGGTQDNNTQYGPSRTRSNSGILNGDWRPIIGGDGHDCAIDPTDPNVIYGESQQGYLRRVDRVTGNSISIRPQPGKGEDGLRYNWDAPILISPHSNTRIYHGSKKLYRSDDRGDSWEAISPDLSRNVDRYKLKHMDRVWSLDLGLYDTYAMSQYSNITSVSESPLVEGLIYVGTDDGLIQITEDGGENWRKVERLFDLPQYAFVNDIKADLHDADTVYATFDHHKTGDYKPYVFKSTDRGQTWSSIVGDLPNKHLVWRINQDHEKADLLFLGTEFGVFFTINGGANWVKLTGNVPTIPFRDIEIQRRENDLVGASFGRSFYVFDDYSFLREVGDEAFEKEELIIYPIRKTYRYVPHYGIGGRKGYQGDKFFSASNPPVGAMITYYNRDAMEVKTKKQVRLEKERKVKKAGGDNTYPGWDVLKEEGREEKKGASLRFTVTDGLGDVISRFEGPTGAGIHRVTWDLRYRNNTFTNGGPLVQPGRYTIAATKIVDGESKAVGNPQEVEVVSIDEESTLSESDSVTRVAYYETISKLRREVNTADRAANDVINQLADIKREINRLKLSDTELYTELYDETRALELKLMDFRELFTGDRIKSKHDVESEPSIGSRLRVANSGSGSIYGPTTTSREQFQIAKDQFEERGGALTTLLEEDLPALHKRLDAANVPWTSGRPLPKP
ncbi:MAG: glycosyl hydrolase [Verrucomicrobiaceae bacterium]|nr:glycosyl hydrolase [Verrucomicrobiaceae bacterium]